MTASASIRLLRDYVAIPSVNPMGRADIPEEIAGETRLADHIRGQLRAVGVDAELVGGGARQSVVADVRCGNPQAETVLVASHLDTVPVDGMEIAPFDPVIESGRLTGRGSCDTKAGMAALIAALEPVLSRGVLRRNLILVGESDEELSSLGVYDVLRALGGRRPDWVLATEPTELRVVHRHKGVVHARIVASGRACHASDPGQGSNAIVALARAAVALDALADRLAERPASELGPATLSIGRFHGGFAPNIVPDCAELIADRRVLPGETLADVERELVAAIRSAGVATQVSLASCRLEKPALGTSPDHRSVQTCLASLRGLGLPASPGTVAFGTDAGVFQSEAGIAGVVMGPGSIQRAHTAREYVEIDQVESMTRFFTALLTSI